MDRVGLKVGRRGFMLGSVLMLTGACGAPVSTTPMQPVDADPEPEPGTIHTVSALLTGRPFYIAHRGSGDNWPEHTMVAYSGAVEAGAMAIEVSVCATEDDVLVCHHDLTLRRTTGDPRAVSEVTWRELQEVRVDARQWLGPNTPLAPIPALREVMDAFAATHVIFIEDKTGRHTAAVLDLLDEYPDSTEHVVWKQWAGAGQRAAAAARGYRTWGYFSDEHYASAAVIAKPFDLIGVSHLADDDQIASVVALGKPVICWEVHYRSVRNRLLSLGVQGMMTSNLPYVAELMPPEPIDSFGTGRRPAGDLPWTTEMGWRSQPEFDPLTKSVALSAPGNQGYHLGSMTPVGATSYSVQWEMRWPEQLAGAGQHAGLAFGQSDDSDYRPLTVGSIGGYHAVLRREGGLELFVRAPGERAGTLLAGVATLPPQPGEWIEIQVDVTPEGIRCVRQGRAPWTITSSDVQFRGGYFSLVRNYAAPIPVQFRAVRVNSL